MSASEVSTSILVSRPFVCFHHHQWISGSRPEASISVRSK